LYIGSQYQIIPRIYLLDANINSFHWLHHWHPKTTWITSLSQWSLLW
jgi:hypothetical protein